VVRVGTITHHHRGVVDAPDCGALPVKVMVKVPPTANGPSVHAKV
jgi:hypothetical protein